MNQEHIMLCIIAFIYNAIVLGWKVKKINTKSFELTKKNINVKNNLHDIVNQIIFNQKID